MGSALNDVESIAVNLPSLEALLELLERRSLDLVVIDESLLPEDAYGVIKEIKDKADPPQVVVVGLEADPERRAALTAAGCLAVIPDSVDEAIFHDCSWHWPSGA